MKRRSNKPTLVEFFPQASEKGQARDYEATLLDTTPRYVSDAKKPADIEKCAAILEK